MIWDFESFSNNVALEDDAKRIVTYKEIINIGDTVKGIANKKCLAFVVCRNSIGSVVGYSSFIQNDIVPALLNANIETDFRENLIKKYKPRYIWAPDEQCGEYIEYGCKKIYGIYEYSLLRTGFEEDYPLNKDLCLMLTTSGSTGNPKFVRQSRKNVISNAKSIAEYLKLNSEEKPITTLPMNYTYGLSIINSHFMVGARILLTECGIMQKKFWSFFRNAGATSFGGVPYTYEMLNRLRFYGMKLPSLKYMTQAGGKLNAELHKKFAEYACETGKKFIVMYGQCEATARMGYLPSEMALEKLGSMGIAIPGGRFSLIDTNGNEIREPNVVGELVYYGDNVTLGYAENGEDLIKGDERFGILQTGDMASFDNDGYFYIVGRKKRFLKIYGNRINLDDIDQMIKSKFVGIDVASAGVDDCLYVFITDESHSKDIREYLSYKTKINSVAFKVVTIDEIPKNDSGKVLYKDLTRYYD